MAAVFAELGEADLRRRARRPGRDRPPDLRRGQPDADARPHARAMSACDQLAGRGGADHRRLHAPPLPDRAARTGLDRPTAIPTQAQRTRERMFGELSRPAGAGHRHPFRRRRPPAMSCATATPTGSRFKVRGRHAVPAAPIRTTGTSCSHFVLDIRAIAIILPVVNRVLNPQLERSGRKPFYETPVQL